jgi:hypothetical protein
LLDIAVATTYAAICVSLIVVMNPVTPREGAAQLAGQSRLDSAVSSYVSQNGLAFFASSPYDQICASAKAASNATLSLDVMIAGWSCSSVTAPPSSMAASSLTLDLPGRTVVIEAWLVRR